MVDFKKIKSKFFLFYNSRNLDLFLFKQINQLAGRFWWLDSLAIFFARYFEFFLIFFLLLFLVNNFEGYWLVLIQIFIPAVLARLVIVEFIRLFWLRPRPFVQNHVNLILKYNPKAASFPSGHASFYFAIAATVFFYNKQIGIFFFIAVFLISLARIFSGIHWPSDIIAGAAVGVFSAFLLSFFLGDFF